MPRITAAQAGGANLCAFLDMLAWSEGTSTSRYTKNDGYDVIVQGIDLTPNDGVDDAPDIFTDYSDHPGNMIVVNRKGLKSSAAGRYQLLLRFWKVYKSLLNLKDFSPLSQDLVAIRQIKERRALDDIHAGRIVTGIGKCSGIWASLPGAGYGQREHKAEDLVAHFIAAGGVMV
ncbi:glycoside hydrolase family 24 protein [Azotobacter chroococcum]|uniref:glycoside hydrolase family 24 protein n=1 Tax=Azotobacter chroococcum TaxID=353 RepID=UPI0010AED24F|nr:glycoside hydrolase family 104 protein [Azotobacter chroococcum]TKD40695.1 lysozyme [Azotobacter chroococcum]